MLVVVGRIGRPHGVRGAVSIDVRTDEPDLRFAIGNRLTADSGVVLTIDSATWHSGRLLLTFEGYPDRTAIETLRGQLLSVERDDSESPEDPEEFYDTALVGCDVVTADGNAVGRVIEVAHLPAQDMLVVAREDSTEVLVPFLEAMVPKVDVQAKRIVITPPPGLLDTEAVEVDS